MTKNPYGQVNDAGWCQCSNNPKLKDIGCGRIFAGITSFDAHHKRSDKGDEWTYACPPDDAVLVNAGFHQDRRGWWHLGDE